MRCRGAPARIGRAPTRAARRRAPLHKAAALGRVGAAARGGRLRRHRLGALGAGAVLPRAAPIRARCPSGRVPCGGSRVQIARGAPTCAALSLPCDRAGLAPDRVGRAVCRAVETKLEKASAATFSVKSEIRRVLR